MDVSVELNVPRRRKLASGLSNFSLMPLRLLSRPMTSKEGQKPAFTPDFTFVHMTDIHLSERTESVRGFRRVIRRINDLSPDFVISGGDQIYDAGYEDHERVEHLYDLYLDAICDLFSPVHHVMGNHDHFGHGQPHIYESNERYGKRFFLDHLGEGRMYRSFRHLDWHFILLDTSHFFDHKFRGHMDAEQLEWLRNELRSVGTDEHVVIVTHVPLLTRLNTIIKGRLEFPIPKLVVSRAREIRNLLHQHSVRLVLQGHIHAVEQLRLGQTWYVNSGAVCSRWWRGLLHHCPNGFTVVSVKGDQIHWRFERVAHH